MVVNCEEVLREVSNYLDGDVEPGLRVAINGHLGGCKRCTAVVDGIRNVITLYADERMIEVPLGFSSRLHRRLEEDMVGGRRNFFGWMVTAAAAVLLAGAVEVARYTGSSRQGLRSEQAETSTRVPPDLPVVVAEDGKIFHVAGCTFIHDKARLRTMTAREAEQQGYAPCVRCLKKYLDLSARSRSPNGDVEDIAGL